MARAVWIAGSLLTVLVGCAAQPRGLTATFPARLGDVSIAPLPVLLRDLTGLATELTLAETFLASGPVNAVPGEPGTLVITWTGGACSDRANLLLLHVAAGGYALRIHENTSLAGMIGCPAVGIPRQVRIRFSQLVAPAQLTVSQTYS